MATLLVYIYIAFHVVLTLVFLKTVFWDKLPLLLKPVGQTRPQYMWNWSLNALILLAIDAILILPNVMEFGGIDALLKVLGWTAMKIVILLFFLAIPHDK